MTHENSSDSTHSQKRLTIACSCLTVYIIPIRPRGPSAALKYSATVSVATPPIPWQANTIDKSASYNNFICRHSKWYVLRMLINLDISVKHVKFTKI